MPIDRKQFEARLKIDRNNLDQELIEQPELFYHVCEQHVKAVSTRDVLYEKRKALEADLSGRIRSEMEKASEKITESRLSAAVAAHEELLDAKGEYLEASREAELWGAMKEAFAQRTYALKDLSGLYSSQYFTRDSAQGNSNKVANAQYEENKENQKHARRRLATAH